MYKNVCYLGAMRAIGHAYLLGKTILLELCINLTASCAHWKVWEVVEFIAKDEDEVWVWVMDKDEA